MRQRAEPGSQGLQELLEANNVIPGWNEGKENMPEVVAADRIGETRVPWRRTVLNISPQLLLAAAGDGVL